MHIQFLIGFQFDKLLITSIYTLDAKLDFQEHLKNIFNKVNKSIRLS